MKSLIQGKSVCLATEQQFQRNQQLRSEWKASAGASKVTEILPTVQPSGRHVAPYTLGCKKTKSKVSWGTRTPETESSIAATRRSPSIQTAYQSRWYDRRGRQFVLKASGSFIYQWFSDSGDRRYIAQLTEYGLQWLIPLNAEHELLQDRVCQFLGIGKDELQNVQWSRQQLLTPLTDVQLDKIRRRGKKARSAQRLDKRSRQKQQQRKVHDLT